MPSTFRHVEIEGHNQLLLIEEPESFQVRHFPPFNYRLPGEEQQTLVCTARQCKSLRQGSRHLRMGIHDIPPCCHEQPEPGNSKEMSR